MQSRKYVDHTDESVTQDLPEFKYWTQATELHLSISGKVVHGFKRGSKELGVPTANIQMTPENTSLVADLIPGVYAAKCRFKDKEKEYVGALSIGWNPQYDNDQKTIEVFLVDKFENDFYDEILELDIKYFLRAEALFGNFDSLILAIQSDIQSAQLLVNIN